MTDPAVPERVTRLATLALNAAIDDDIDRASRAVKAISDEAGGEGLGWAVTAWCDTLILHYRRVTGTPDTAPMRPGWYHAGRAARHPARYARYLAARVLRRIPGRPGDGEGLDPDEARAFIAICRGWKHDGRTERSRT